MHFLTFYSSKKSTILSFEKRPPGGSLLTRKNSAFANVLIKEESTFRWLLSTAVDCAQHGSPGGSLLTQKNIAFTNVLLMQEFDSSSFGARFARFAIPHFVTFCKFEQTLQIFNLPKPPTTLTLDFSTSHSRWRLGRAVYFHVSLLRVKCVHLAFGKNLAYQKCRPPLVKFTVHLKYSLKRSETC